MNFEVIVSPAAAAQINEQALWYEVQQDGLGFRFEAVVSELLLFLSGNPFAQLRYDNVRCVPIIGFPAMLHIEINEDIRVVNVLAMIHTAHDPDSHWGRTDWFVSEPEVVYGVA